MTHPRKPGKPQLSPKVPEDGSFSIENILPKIERTFLQVGTTIGKYRIQEEIDRGGMAVVYRAIQLDLDREVALKVLPANITINRRFVDRFLAEAHAVARLSHPNIVSIHEVAMEDNVYFLAMDYIPGRNLYYNLHFGKPKLVDVLEIAAELADALAYAHRQKIVHRDLKLNNVIMRDDTTPVLIDFGLAKALEGDAGTLTQTGEIVGSPAYMAPERILGHKSDGRSDICSLGIMLYEMLTFKNPYLDPRSIHQTTMNVLEGDPIPPRKLVPWLSPEIEAITLKAMHPDPQHRYQTMEEFAEDIRRYQRGKAVTARNPSFVSRCTRFFTRNWAWLTIGILLLVFSGLFGASIYLQSRKERPRWQLVYANGFEQPEEQQLWTSAPLDSSWRVEKGAFRGESDGVSYARLEKPFTRDMMVEFDLLPPPEGVVDAGVFLYGTDPDSAYRFYVFRNGVPGGIEYAQSRFLFRKAGLEAIPVDTPIHVVVKRNENVTTLVINGVLVGAFWDFMPLLGNSHRNLGFFVRGGRCFFDNVKVYRLTIPQLSSPTMVADRFWERGDFDAAMEEYNALLIDYPELASEKEMILRIAECHFRRNEFDRAGTLLSTLLQSEVPDHLRPFLFFTRGMIDLRTSGALASFEPFETAARIAKYHPVNHTAVSFLVMNAMDSLQAGSLDAAAKISAFCNETYPRDLELVGRIDCGILSNYYDRRDYEKLLGHADKMEPLYKGAPSVLAESRRYSGMALLCMRKTQQAIDKFNQSISAGAPGIQVWESWMALGEIYETNYDHADAHDIYRKVFEEAPDGNPQKQLARLRMGLAGRFVYQVDSLQVILSQVANSSSPFPFPKILAELYTGGISEERFIAECKNLGISENQRGFYLARKSVLQGNLRQAQEQIRRLRSLTPFYTWEYVRLEHALKNTEAW